MAQTIPFPVTYQGVSAGSRTQRIPWYIWSYLSAVTCAVVGMTWDISWHMSIGRDTFWSPPHIFVYAAGTMAGLTAAWLILTTTFLQDAPLRPASVRMWGFQGPLGAFLAAWGALAMLSSAPFDDWWHNAYGLDTKILSPPHILLAFGLLGIRFGALLLTLGEMNRAGGDLKKRLTAAFLALGAMTLGIAIGTFLELSSRNLMHSARFYMVFGCTVPVVLLAIREASGHRWGATICSGIVTMFQLLLLWVLPLFSAEPKLGPVYQQITHFIPNPFPLLMIFPAIALDLLRQRHETSNRWVDAAIAGPLFVAVLFVAQWPFADFLNSPLSRNWIFGTHYLAYFVPPTHDMARNVYTQVETTSGQFALRIAIALAGSILSARVGLAWGAWMSRLRR